jgi:hypothetical protein
MVPPPENDTGTCAMKFHHILTVALAAAALAACQPPAPADTTTELPVAEGPTTETPTIPANCAVLNHRDWDAELAAGASPTLTVEGEVELPTPGYSVSLARDPSEPAGATETRLTLNLAPPAGIVAQVVTPTPVRYFGPAGADYASVTIECGDGDLVTIPLTPPAP